MAGSVLTNRRHQALSYIFDRNRWRRQRSLVRNAEVPVPYWWAGHGYVFSEQSTSSNSTPTGSSPQDYTRRFPMDPYGQEMSENARVWQTYVEEAVSFDGEKLDEYRDTIDVLLVFVRN